MSAVRHTSLLLLISQLIIKAAAPKSKATAKALAAKYKEIRELRRANARASTWWCNAFQQGRCQYADNECPHGAHINKEDLDRIKVDINRRRLPTVIATQLGLAPHKFRMCEPGQKLSLRPNQRLGIDYLHTASLRVAMWVVQRSPVRES